jgi:hypothetical protein
LFDKMLMENKTNIWCVRSKMCCKRLIHSDFICETSPLSRARLSCNEFPSGRRKLRKLRWRAVKRRKDVFVYILCEKAIEGFLIGFWSGSVVPRNNHSANAMMVVANLTVAS